MPAKLPPPKSVRDLFEGLLGKDVTVATGKPVARSDSAALAVYVTDAMKMSAVVNLDLPLAAYLGASIALIPAGGAAAAIQERYLSEALFDNVGEILNVFAATLNENSTDHQRLHTTHRGATAASTEAAQLAASVGNRMDLAVTISRYGSGTMSCVLAA